MAATPAGSDKTPDPTHPLIKLNAAAEIVCSFALELGVASEAVADDALIRIFNPPAR